MPRQEQIPLSIRIAAAAVARQQGLNREEYRQLCQRLLRQTVQSQTHQFDRMFDYSARSTQRNFERAGIGERYTNPSQLRPGDLVYSDQGSPQYGHAMVVGTDGQLYDQVGHGAPTDQGYRHPSWIVHPDQAIANYNTARDSGQDHHTAATVATIAHPQLPTNPGMDANAPSLFPQTAPNYVTPRNLGYSMEVHLGQNSPPSNWELGPSEAQYGNNFGLAPGSFYNPDTNMVSQGGNYTQPLNWQSIPPSPDYSNPVPHENQFPSGPGYDYQNPSPFENNFIPYEGYQPSLNNPAPYEQPFQSPEQYSGYNPMPEEQGYLPSDFYQPGNDLQTFGGDTSLGSDVPSADQSLWYPADYGSPQPNQGGMDIYNFGGDMSLGPDMQPYVGPSGHHQGQDQGYTGPTSVEFPTQYGIYNGPVEPQNQVTPGVGFTNYGAGQYIPVGSHAPSNFYQFQYNSTPSTSGAGYNANMRARSLNISPFADTAGVSSLLASEGSGYGGTGGGLMAPHYQANMLRRMQGGMMGGPNVMFSGDPNEGLQNPALDATRALLSGTQGLRHVGA